MTLLSRVLSVVFIATIVTPEASFGEPVEAGLMAQRSAILASASREVARLIRSESKAVVPQNRPQPLSQVRDDVLDAQLTDGWLRVQSLPFGAQVRVTFVSGTTIEGLFVRAFPDSLIVQASQLVSGSLDIPEGQTLRDRLTFSRDEIVLVQVVTPQGASFATEAKVAIAAGVVAVIIVALRVIIIG